MKFSLRLRYTDSYRMKEIEPKSLEITEEKTDEVLKFLEKKTYQKFKIYEQDYALCTGKHYVVAIDKDLEPMTRSSIDYDWYVIEVNSKEITSKQVLEVFATILDSGFRLCFGGIVALPPSYRVEIRSLEELMIEMELEK